MQGKREPGPAEYRRPCIPPQTSRPPSGQAAAGARSHCSPQCFPPPLHWHSRAPRGNPPVLRHRSPPGRRRHLRGPHSAPGGSAGRRSAGQGVTGKEKILSARVGVPGEGIASPHVLAHRRARVVSVPLLIPLVQEDLGHRSRSNSLLHPQGREGHPARGPCSREIHGGTRRELQVHHIALVIRQPRPSQRAPLRRSRHYPWEAGPL
jgi:hypothetical protein